MRIFLVLTQNYWGRSTNLAAAKRRCMQETGARTFKEHLKYVRNPKWIEFEFEVPDDLPKTEYPYVDGMGGVFWVGELIKREERE